MVAARGARPASEMSLFQVPGPRQDLCRGGQYISLQAEDNDLSTEIGVMGTKAEPGSRKQGTHSVTCLTMSRPGKAQDEYRLTAVVVSRGVPRCLIEKPIYQARDRGPASVLVYPELAADVPPAKRLSHRNQEISIRSPLLCGTSSYDMAGHRRKTRALGETLFSDGPRSYFCSPSQRCWLGPGSAPAARICVAAWISPRYRHVAAQERHQAWWK